MNLLLLDADRVAPDGHATITGAALEHVRTVLKKGVGDTLVAGVVDGKIGTATIEAIGADEARVRCTFDRDPPPPSPVTLVLALPRPPMLRRVLFSAASMGVKAIHLIATARVEKSYWSTPSLQPDKIAEQLRLGLAQAVDTTWPAVELHRRFRPFVEDVLSDVAGDGARLVADPVPGAAPLEPARGPVTVVIGPEGGLVPFERERLAAAGFSSVHLGPRILRVETAVVAVLARLLALTPPGR